MKHVHGSACLLACSDNRPSRNVGLRRHRSTIYAFSETAPIIPLNERNSPILSFFFFSFSKCLTSKWRKQALCNECTDWNSSINTSLLKYYLLKIFKKISRVGTVAKGAVILCLLCTTRRRHCASDLRIAVLSNDSVHIRASGIFASTSNSMIEAS